MHLLTACNGLTCVRFAAAHLRNMKQDGGETQQALQPGTDSTSAVPTAVAYAGELGPAMPGDSGSCEVVLGSTTNAEATVGLGAWLAELRASVEANNAPAYASGMRRLCGEGRFRPSSVPFQAAIPTDVAQLASVLDQFGQLGQACSAAASAASETSVTDQQSQYAAAYNALCPVAAAPGPAMPANCEFVIASPRGGQEGMVQLPLFLEHMRQSLESGSEATWLKSLKLLCGGSASSATPWSNRAPYPGTTDQKTVLKWVDDLRHSCGLEKRNEQLYKAAWDGICRAAPVSEEGVAVTCEDTVRIMERRVTKIRTALESLKAAAHVAAPLVSDTAAQEGLSKAVAAADATAQ